MNGAETGGRSQRLSNSAGHDFTVEMILQEKNMNIRRLVLDVDKAIARPSMVEIAQAIESVHGVAGFNITVLEIDVETIGTEVTIEGENLDYEALRKAIESTGAVVHSVDQLAGGSKLVEWIPRKR
jgi:hypothetical protein